MTPSTSSAKKKRSVPLWAAAFWLLCWEAAARWVDEPILLVSPLQAIRRFFQLLWQPQFWQSVGFSLGHILLGFFMSLALALLLAVLSYRHRWVRQLLSPLTATVKAIPVVEMLCSVENKEPIYSVGGNVKWCPVAENSLVGLRKIKDMIQLFHFQVYTPDN